METFIRWWGWGGIILNAYAIYSRSVDLFILGQLTSSITSFFWSIWLQKKITADLIISLGFTALSVYSRDSFMIYAAMLSRSISYQLQFERIVKDRNKNTKH